MAQPRDPARDNSTLYRPCVGIALFKSSGDVFVGRRRQDPGGDAEGAAFAWQMPQGGIDEGEAPLAAALRELYEETNVSSVTLLDEAPDWLSYDLPPTAGQSGKRRFKGQSQRWFAFRFTGQESEIDVLRPGGGRHKAEFMDWRWVALAETPELIIPFKRPVYEAVARAFMRHSEPR